MTSHVTRAQAEKGRELLERVNGGPPDRANATTVVVCVGKHLDQDQRRELRDWITKELDA